MVLNQLAVCYMVLVYLRELLQLWFMVQNSIHKYIPTELLQLYVKVQLGDK